MKSLLAAVALTVMGSVVGVSAFASEFEIVGSIYQNQQGDEVVVPKTKEGIRICIDTCIDTFGKPGAELKACVTKCAN